MKLNLFLSGFICAFIFFSSEVFAVPAQVVIIRHGEKPAVGNELNEKGWQRANALPSFFENNKIVNEFGSPVAIYAGAPNNPSGSIRSIQTITPYANQVGLSIHQKITKDNIDTLVKEVMSTQDYDGHTVVICWEHTVIPAMAQLFGVTDAPATWDSSVFDRAWVIQFEGGKVSSFQNIAEHVLPTDSQN